ncbi:MAG: hypothetical protein NT058_01760, partial [Candidatus Portnoybacteria bacterium]|nr:hypothetical protein [Candidatus Portnoybacteria bacterium]
MIIRGVTRNWKEGRKDAKSLKKEPSSSAKIRRSRNDDSETPTSNKRRWGLLFFKFKLNCYHMGPIDEIKSRLDV